MKRKVIGTEHWYNPGAEKSRFTGGGRMLKLECGHEIRRKLSQPIPKISFCVECDRLKNKNGERTQFNMATKTAEFETWDEATQMPVPHVRPMTEEEIKEWSR